MIWLDSFSDIDLSHINPALRLKLSSRAKRFSLRLDSKTKRMNLIVPKRNSIRQAFLIKQAVLFAEMNQKWIEEKLADLSPLIQFTHGQTIPFCGHMLTLIVKQDTSRKTILIQQENNFLNIHTPHLDFSPRLVRYFKKHAHDYFSKIAQEKASTLNRSVHTLKLRDMSSRWGSCSVTGQMTLNWRLAFAPFEAYDYVIAHEVAHLIHPHHRKSFWDLCEKLSVDYHQGKRWMAENGALLHRFGN
jgi:predicted metal-dependent hydrolase